MLMCFFVYLQKIFTHINKHVIFTTMKKSLFPLFVLFVAIASSTKMIAQESVTSLSVVPDFKVGGYPCVEVPALYCQPVLGVYNADTKNEAYYYYDTSGNLWNNQDGRFDDGQFAPPSNLPAIPLSSTMDGYDSPDEPWQTTMLNAFRDRAALYANVKTTTNVPLTPVTYKLSPKKSFTLSGYTLELLTNTSLVSAPMETRATGSKKSMADNFCSNVITEGSNYQVINGITKVPLRLTDWVNYAEDLAYYVSAGSDNMINDSVNFISLQLSKDGVPVITSDEAAVIPGFYHIDCLIDSKPQNNDNEPMVLYKNARSAVDAKYTHSVIYSQSLDILPFIKTRISYIGGRSNWKEQSMVLDDETFKKLNLRYVFSPVMYEDGNHATGESLHISIDAIDDYNSPFEYEKVVLTPHSVRLVYDGTTYQLTQAEGPATREAVDREPLIKVELVDLSGQVLNVGYIKVLIKDEPFITTGLDEVDEPDVMKGWYTIGGQKLSGKPTAKGVYIYNGKTVVN